MSDSIGNRKELPWLAGHPIHDPKQNAPALDPGWISGAMVGEPDVREDMVVAAINAMSAFAGDVRRDRALMILKHWRRFTDMRPAEVLAVLDTYPAPKKGGPAT